MSRSESAKVSWFTTRGGTDVRATIYPDGTAVVTWNPGMSDEFTSTETTGWLANEVKYGWLIPDPV